MKQGWFEKMSCRDAFSTNVMSIISVFYCMSSLGLLLIDIFYYRLCLFYRLFVDIVVISMYFCKKNDEVCLIRHKT